MRRELEISKYRNLGFDEPDHLLINGSTKKGELGGVVTLIGQNNAGKSNVLQALLQMSNGKQLTNQDVTHLSYDPKDRNPCISLIYRDEDKYVKIKKTYGSNNLIIEHNLEDASTEPTLAVIRKEMKALRESMPTNYEQNYTNVLKMFKIIENGESSKELVVSTIKNLFVFFEGELINHRNYGYNPFVQQMINAFNGFKQKSETYSVYSSKANEKERKNALLCKKFLEKGGLSETLNIIEYKESPISEGNLVLGDIPNEIENNHFFRSLFNIVGIQKEEIINVYKEYMSHSNVGILKKEEKKIAKKMDEINKRFNSLYFAENDEYKFDIRLESEKILFSMVRGKDDDPIMLNSQSTGFRWFFNLYFNFLAINVLHPGDIVIMDEVGSFLHPQGLVELRKFLSEYGKRTGVTFVVATHSPFFIDRDNLDELRVVSSKQNKAYIDNLFTAVNDDDPDSLLPIKESLTIKQNVLYDYDTEVVWVEGITDYCYLTMFKNLLGIKDICFLPFNGVGRTKEQTSSILKRLLSIKLFKRSILVDGDKAGMDMFNQCEGTFFEDRRYNISQLTTNDHKYMMVEDLFSKEDKEKYPSINSKNDKYKRAVVASCMKSNCKLSDFSKPTIDNFKRLFDLIQDK